MVYLHPSVSLETLKVYQAEADRLGVTVDELAAEVVAFWALIPPATQEKARQTIAAWDREVDDESDDGSPEQVCTMCGRFELVSEVSICNTCYEKVLA